MTVYRNGRFDFRHARDYASRTLCSSIHEARVGSAVPLTTMAWPTSRYYSIVACRSVSLCGCLISPVKERRQRASPLPAYRFEIMGKATQASSPQFPLRKVCCYRLESNDAEGEPQTFSGPSAAPEEEYMFPPELQSSRVPERWIHVVTRRETFTPAVGKMVYVQRVSPLLRCLFGSNSQ